MTSCPGAILVLVGTKAQFIKTAPILREFDRRGTRYRLIYTGQHRETFDALERVFGTRPADDLMVPGDEADSAGGLAAWGVRFLRAAIARRREWRGARWGVVHGDTASTLLGALALMAAGVPVAHVEAGLRSPRLLSPFPEEIVRRLVSRVATLHLAPDAAAKANLSGVAGRVVDTGGNTLRDALVMALDAIGEASEGGGDYAIVSLHRSENLASRGRFDALMGHVASIAARIPVRFVLHPVTKRKLATTGWARRLEAHERIVLLERMDYVEFVRLMLDSRFLVTDGGSNQEEAAMLGLPTLLMRDATERPDGLGDGVRLSRFDPGEIDSFVESHRVRRWTPRAVTGTSPSARVVDELLAADRA